MYEAFYGLQKKPFSILPDPEFIYWAGPHSLAFAMLDYGVASHAGFTVITGEVGSGKTTLIRCLLDKLSSDITVGFVPNLQEDRSDLLQRIMMALHQESEGLSYLKLYRKLEEFLLGEQSEGRRTVLLIDEAQTLGLKSIEELRLLSNINVLYGELVQVVLTGQPELKRLLRRPELLQFAQRVSSDFHINLLSKAEVPAYINHRLAVAGANRILFSNDASELVFLATQGTPRLINVLCDTAMIYGFAVEEAVISASTVHKVLDDKRKYGVLHKLPAVRSVRARATSPLDAAEISRRRLNLAKAVRKIEPASVSENPAQSAAWPEVPPSLHVAPVPSERLEGNDLLAQPALHQTHKEAMSSPNAAGTAIGAIEPVVTPPTPGLKTSTVASEPAQESGSPSENILSHAMQGMEMRNSAAGAPAGATEDAAIRGRADADHHGGARVDSLSERLIDWARPSPAPSRNRYESLEPQLAGDHNAHDGFPEIRLSLHHLQDRYNWEGTPEAPAIDRQQTPNRWHKKRAPIREDRREVLKHNARRLWSPSPSLLLTVLITTVILGTGTVAWSNRAMIGQIVTALDNDAASSKAVHPINPLASSRGDQ
jgi:type II secretory pathway predicted ATPase ExeA